jgi:Zn-dependent protease
MASLGSGNAGPQYSGADYGYGTDHPVQADITPYSPAATPSRGGLAAGIVAILGLLLKFKGFALSAVSIALAAWAYGWYFGWWAFGIGFVLLILIHESGHLLVARALRLPATLPVMLPFLGAFVAMRQRPKTVAEEAQMAVGGPILGSIASALCYVGYLTAPNTYWGGLLIGLAYFGFVINLFNLVPVTPLDGGRVMSVVSKWFNVAGLLVAVGLLLLTHFQSPILFLIVIVGAFSTWQRFRSTVADPAYYQVPTSARWALGGVYLALLLALTMGVEVTHGLLPPNLA